MTAGRDLSYSLLCGRQKSLHISHSAPVQGITPPRRIIHNSIETWVWAALSTEMKANLEGWGGVFSPNSDLFRFFALSAVWQVQVILLKQGWVCISTSQSQLEARWQMVDISSRWKCNIQPGQQARQCSSAQAQGSPAMC